jgi:excisionase family DNA binding protein
MARCVRPVPEQPVPANEAKYVMRLLDGYEIEQQLVGVDMGLVALALAILEYDRVSVNDRRPADPLRRCERVREPFLQSSPNRLHRPTLNNAYFRCQANGISLSIPLMSATLTERLLQPREVAAYLGVSPATLRTWYARRDGPPAIKVGKFLRYRRADVEAWLNEQASAP